ncbi:MAG TPA: oxidoreductase [Verrucomicrobiales bacterium]|nr:oxidoreductase [Verrucomicrobiales bacterium]
MNGGMSRRRLITTGLAAAAGLSGMAVAARLARKYGLVPPDGGGPYGAGTTLTYAAQRVLTRHTLAREFPRGMISKRPFANGAPPTFEEFTKLQAGGFSDWRLEVNGMVSNPGSFSLPDLRSLPPRSQVTQVVCEEGWSYIAEWIGTPLSLILQTAGILPQARFVVYYSIEKGMWDSLDMADALHPQTLVTYGFNGGDLPVRFGGPLRIRVPRQLAYKSVKYLTRLTVTDDLRNFGKGLGSASAEEGYSWCPGI